METAPLKSFATWARRELITQVSARLTAALAPASPERVENRHAVAMLERDIKAAGGGAQGKDAIADKVAYTWFNRIIALRFMDANGYTGIGVVSPAHDQRVGQPQILADAKRGSIDPAVITSKRTLDTITGLLDGTRPSADAQGEAYTLLLAEYCRYWNRSMPFMFEREGDYTELLIPANLLAADSILTRAAAALTEEVCREVEVIGWLYQFYISERKDEVFAGFKKGRKAGASEIPAATQLFTPHWIVRYLVENSVGRLWMLNHPSSRLVDQMDYYIAPVDDESDFLKITSPEELTVIDPACGSGHMLTYAFDLLYAIYEEEGYAPSEIPELILTHNLYGAEIDPRAGALAAFALLMKARSSQRTFFSRQIEPNICVIRPLSFGPEELGALSVSGDDQAEEDFWNQFAEADIVGALIQPSTEMTLRMVARSSAFDRPGDMLQADLFESARRVIRQADFLLPNYSVVIANPPYMGGGNLAPELSDFAKHHYPDSKSDLFAMFIQRAMSLAVPNGYVAMITMQGWMFLSSFKLIRARMLARTTISTMAHLGANAFDSIPGEVVATTAFVLRMRATDDRGVFVRLVSGRSEREKAATLRAAQHSDSEFRWTASGDEFASFPGKQISYWVGSGLKALFSADRLGDRLSIGSGLSTADNARFLRFIWEISRSTVGLDVRDIADTVSGEHRWYLFHKGGEYRKWYGNLLHVVNWERDGAEIKDWVVNNPQDPNTTQWSRRIFNTDLYFRPGIVWSTITTGKPSFRLAPAGTMISNAAGGIFDLGAGEARLDLMGALNSNAWAVLLQTMNPTVNFSSGILQGAPAPKPVDTDLVTKLCELAACDWAESEISWEFAVSPVVAVRRRAPRLHDAVDIVLQGWRVRTEEARCAEERLNREVNTSHALSGEIPSAVAVEEITLNSNPAYRYRNAGENVDKDALLEQDLIVDLVSYAVGCMFGRYSVDEPGLILGDQGATVQDYLARVPRPTFAPDADNVLPIVDGDWFEDDIVARFRQFLRAAFGEEHFEENLRFVEESLGVKALQEYFVTRAGRSKFYDDHVKRYKKRPIYWLFSSPRGSFNALIYMHRYTPSTVSTVLNEYLREFEAKLEANLQHQERLAAGDGTPREKAAALKESERLRKVLLELGEYEHDVLYPLASQQIAIDLDDGVKVNYPKFYPALKKITGLEAAE